MQRAREHVVDAPDDAGETDRMDVLSEIEGNGGAGEADRMNVLSEVQDPSGTGETDRLDALLEIGTKSCEAADSASEAHIKTCEAGTDSARQVRTEDAPVEASVLQFVDTVGGTPVVAQMQITMVHTEIEALRCWLRVISHEI